jgi:hypothetical protein
MPEDTAKEAEVLKPAPGGIRAATGFKALNVLVNAARECFETHQVESTKRSKLNSYEVIEVARIKAAEATLRSYFEQVFAERRKNFKQLFTRLDGALDRGDGEAHSQVVRSIVDIARTSPLADLGDRVRFGLPSMIRTKFWDLKPLGMMPFGLHQPNFAVGVADQVGSPHPR